jgi:hypothetical protein
MSGPVAAHNARVARGTTSDPSGRPGASTGLTRPIYRLRSRGRIEVLTARGHWQRKALIPPNGIQVADAPLTESELRWLHGDR